MGRRCCVRSPAVGDLADDLERLLQVDGVGDHLQGQSDVPVARRLRTTGEQNLAD